MKANKRTRSHEGGLDELFLLMGKDIFFEEARELLCRVRSRKQGHIKHILFSTEFHSDKRKLYAVVSETIKAKRIIKYLLKRSKLYRENRGACDGTGCQNCANLVEAFEMLLGQQELGDMGRPVMQRWKFLEKEVERFLEKKGIEHLTAVLQDKVEDIKLPIFVRVNTLKTKTKKILRHFKAKGYQLLELEEDADYNCFLKTVRQLEEGQFVKDFHFENLFVFPPNTDFHLDARFTAREVVVQDKASCIAAAVLAPPPGAVVIDACAAPGNKTSQLAASMRNSGRLLAVDRDGSRFQTLCSLLEDSGVTCAQTMNQDFLRIHSNDPRNADVEFILVDPSCSGSGIMRDIVRASERNCAPDKRRIASLGNFQATLLRHALSFPNVKRVVYSTCSIHEGENEAVVAENAERYKDKFELVKIWPEWPRRGRLGLSQCLRTDSMIDLTNGFFVACFQRLGGE